MSLIYLSPSSQGYNRYAYAATSEAVQMRKIAVKMESILRCYGFQTVLPGEILTMEQRIEQANNLGADYYISLHSSGGGGSGGEVFYCSDKQGSFSLATAMYTELAAISRSEGRGVKDGMQAYGGLGFAELRLVQNCPVMVKVEFHDRTDLAKWICDNTENIANCLATAIVKTLTTDANKVADQTEPSVQKETDYYRLYIQYGVFQDEKTANKASDLLGNLGFRRVIFFGK